MRFFFFLILTMFLTSLAKASVKEKIIKNLNSIDNLTFKFEQNINGKIERGDCFIKYPKKIFCQYDLGNKKIMVSNGKSLVIKTLSSYYIYPLARTPLNLILDKEYLLKKIRDLKLRNIDEKYINFSFIENDNKINIFFDKNTFNLIGWQTIDIYQNLIITYLFSITKNENLNNNLFILPNR